MRQLCYRQYQDRPFIMKMIRHLVCQFGYRQYQECPFIEKNDKASELPEDGTLDYVYRHGEVQCLRMLG